MVINGTAIAIVDNGEAELISRNYLPLDQFGPIKELLESWKMRVVLDGEIVTLNEQGNAEFTT